MTPRADDVPRRQLGMNGVRRAERTSGDMAAQRAARRFVMVMPMSYEELEVIPSCSVRAPRMAGQGIAR
jgi:hypothetical protein